MFDICGIDEAGRGALAGPLMVAGVRLTKNIDGITDSKKLTSTKREELYHLIVANSFYCIVSIGNKKIDKNGLSYITKFAIYDIMSEIDASRYIFDGNTTFNIPNLTSMIKGDLKIKSIGAASILAKVVRDKYMLEIDSRYKNFSFNKHKGYGTKKHIQEIIDFGYTDIHRSSFNIKSLKGTS